jgi:aspartate kinase
LRRRRGLAVRCQTGSTAAPFLRTEEPPAAAAGARNAQAGFTFVMKFGGSSLASAERMREVAGLILSFLDEMPVAVLSAMGKTTNNLLLGPSISSSQRLSQGARFFRLLANKARCACA